MIINVNLDSVIGHVNMWYFLKDHSWIHTESQIERYFIVDYI